MKSPAPNDEIETNLTGTASPLRIRQNAKIWALLTDKVYSNKEKATVRELWTNALDSHIAAGTKRPFLTALPSVLEQTFVVRDYGTGMDHDKVIGLYSELGGSDKDLTNEVTGMLGIGSKAPLSLCDAFTVTCYDGTEARSYFVAMGEDGTPGITLVGTEESTEPQGVEVSVPVAANRVEKVRAEAANVALGFYLDGNLPKGAEDVFTDPSVLLKGEYVSVSPEGEPVVLNWWVIDHPALEDSEYFIKQGPVLYPVTGSVVPEKVLDTGYHRNIALVVEVPLGTADVGADRESLSYDEATTANLQAIFAEVTPEITEVAKAARQSAPNWRARCEVTEAQSRFLRLSSNDVGATRSVYVAGGSDWEPPTFLTGARFTKKVSRPEIGRRSRHPLEAEKFPTEELGENAVAALAKRPPVVEFRFDSVPRARFYLLRPGTVRAADRIRRDISHYTHGYRGYTGGKDFYVLDNPTPRQIERLMHLCGFTREQFVEVASIADIPPEPKARKERVKADGTRERVKTLTGVYKLDNWDRKLTALEEFPEGDYLWVRSPDRRADSNVPTFTHADGGVLWKSQADLHREIPKALLEWLGLPTVIIGFSEKAVDKYSPDPAMELHVALRSKITDGLLERAKVTRSVEGAISSLAGGYNCSLNHEQTRRVIAPLLPLLAPDYDPEPMLAHDKIQRLLPYLGYRQTDQLAETIEAAAKAAYPELFKPYLTDKDLDRYLAGR